MQSVRKVLLCASVAGMVIIDYGATASESTDWLVHNPVSMMDWGSQNAEKAAQNAIDQLNKEMEAKEKEDEVLATMPDDQKKQLGEGWKKLQLAQKYGYEFQYAHAGYDQPNDRILISSYVIPRLIPLSMHSDVGKVDTDSCIALVEDFRKYIMGGGTAEQVALSWFGRSYPFSATPNFTKDLLAHIAVEISLDKYRFNLPPAIKCTEPFGGGPVTIVNAAKK
jgi:hypothetical protein